MLWGYTLRECRPWLKHRQREIIFREAVLAFLGVRSEEGCGPEQRDKCRAQFGEYLKWACDNCEKKGKAE